MTDKDIIKALHTACLLDPKNIFIRNYITGEITTLNMDDVLNLINRQQAEIERLKIENQSLKKAVNSLKGALLEEQYCTNKVRKQINSARTEAIKEFAERLKNEMRLEDDCQYDCMNCYYECKEYVPIIDDLVKEVVGDNK